MNTENNNMEVFLKHNGPIAEQNILSDAIARLGIEKIEVVFDGCGDSGQIESTEAFDKNGTVLDVKLDSIAVGKVQFTTGYRYNGDGTTTPVTQVRDATMEDIIEEICYNLLEKKHGGWEINEGSFGTFTIDLRNKKIHLEYNERVTEVNTSEDSFDFNLNPVDHTACVEDDESDKN